jgi:hypothetical protein
MTADQVAKLKPGDKVFWHDPDEELCSRVLTIKHITIDGEDSALISDVGGSDLGVLFDEINYYMEIPYPAPLGRDGKPLGGSRK